MSATRKQVLQDYKKSNKTRKPKLVAKWGYKTEKEFLAYLQADPDAVCAVVTSEPKAKGKRGRKPGGKNTPKVAPVKVELTPLNEFKDGEKATDYVIAFDTTGSMSSYIASVRKHVVELVEKLFSNTTDLRIKIVAFGDYCDMISKDKFGKAYQEIELTNDKNALIAFVNGAQNTGGGDGDEFYELVIRKINTETKWREGTAKSVLFIADDEPHKVGYTFRDIVKSAQIDWKQEAQEAKRLGIQYDTLRIHADYDWYRELSEITGGVCMNFKNAANISKVVEGTVYARSSVASFNATSKAVMDSGDAELMGAFKTMATLNTDLEG